MTGISTTRAVERCERLAALGPAPAWWRVFALRRWLRAYRAIMALDISVHAEMLRTVYTKERILETMNRPNPMFALLRGRERTTAAIAKSPKGEYLGRKWVEPIEVMEPVRSDPDGETYYDTYSVEVRE